MKEIKFKVADRVRTTAFPPGVNEASHTVGEVGTVVAIRATYSGPDGRPTSDGRIIVKFDRRDQGWRREGELGHWSCEPDGLERHADITPEEALAGLNDILEVGHA